MKEKGVRQIDLHNNTDIPKSTITGYVKGSSLPTPGNLQKIADFLNVKKSDLDLRFIPKEESTFYGLGFDFGRLYGGIKNLTQEDYIIINEGESPWNLHSDLDLNLSKNLNKVLDLLTEISEREEYLSLRNDQIFITALNLIEGTININESNKEVASELIHLCDEITQNLKLPTSDEEFPLKKRLIEGKKHFNFLSWFKRE